MKLWQWLDRPGHEASRLTRHDDGWQLAGCAAFAHEAKPCALTYAIECDAQWRTKRAQVNGWVGERDIAIEIQVDDGWWMNGSEVAEVRDCIDIDLNFSPSTNVLPIRRLGLSIGQEAIVRAAWLRFPSFTLEPFEQRYTRVDESHVRYQSLAGDFEALLTVDAEGMVIDYPPVWRHA